MKEMKSSILSFLFSGLVAFSLQAQEVSYVPIGVSDSMDEIVRKAANVVPSDRQFLWQRQELTAFIHFGMNTFTGREWGDGKESPSLFNPTHLDADQWICTLKEAGFKCAILTCKHHDGFCLWPSAYTEHSVMHSPWKGGKGDVVREVSDACRRHGLSFGVYLSPWDMNTPLYGTAEYNTFFVNQLTELLTNYGEVGEVWFDGACGEGVNGKKQVYDFVRWYGVIRSLQPQAVIAVMGPDVRWVGTESGRGRATEWSVVPNDNLDPSFIANRSQQEVLTPPVGDMMGEDLGSRHVIRHAKTLVWYPAEIDVSIRPGWFYHEREDAKVKSGRDLMDIYFTSVGMNGVLLLNIPPTPQGLFAQRDVESLRDFRDLHSRIFAQNLLQNAVVKSNRGKKHLSSLVDGNYDTSYSKERGEGELILTFQLRHPTLANVLCLQEDIRHGQRVEQFYLECKRPNEVWQTIATGTTIGHKRLIRFEDVEATVFRLHITQSRLYPYLSEVGLYHW